MRIDTGGRTVPINSVDIMFFPEGIKCHKHRISTDALWYYVGGTQRGHWGRVLEKFEFEEDIAEYEDRLRRMGYATRRGKLSIGPPDGPPSEHGGRK